MQCLGRISIALSVLFWFERRVLDIAGEPLRSAAFYGAALFVGASILRNVVSGVFAGPRPDMEVHEEVGTLRRDTVTWAACGMRGWRPAMEDAHVVAELDSSLFPDAALFAVLDGHGGAEVSALVSGILANEVNKVARERRRNNGSEQCSLEEALLKSLPRIDARIRTGPLGLLRFMPASLHPFGHVGSTACVAAVDFEAQRVLVANVGDSRAMLIRRGREGRGEAIELSKDHKPEDPIERTRIQNAGGRVVKMGPCWRVDGNLNLSRALGDFKLKDNLALPPEKQKVSAFPDLEVKPYRGGIQELLLVGCDGLFERLDNKGVAEIVWPRYQSGMPLQQIGKELLHACCASSTRGGQPTTFGTDNETVILVRLPLCKAEAADAEGVGIIPGATVRIQGLTSEAGQPLNGQTGIVEGPGEAGGRYDVRLSDGVKSFKAANLRVDEEAPAGNEAKSKRTRKSGS